MSTIKQIVDLADQLRENALPQEVKVRWIGELDALIALDVMGMDVADALQFRYDPEADAENEPLLRFPHDGLYHYWLCAKIDAENGEYGRYQNSLKLYNAAFLDYRSWYSRVYDPARTKLAEPTAYFREGEPGTGQALTVGRLVEAADQLRENAIPQEMKVRWIGELDALIAADVMGFDILELEQFRYDPEADLEREPLLRFPHDGLYHYWLCAKIDAENGEYSRYQNIIQLYNAAFLSFRAWFSRVYNIFGQSPGAPTHYLSAYGLAVQQGYPGTLEQWLKDLVGPQGEQGPQGEPGNVFDELTAEQLERIRGPQGEQGPAGADGQDGADGYSPTVAVEDIGGGHRVTITDKDGERTFDVMDGEADSDATVTKESIEAALGYTPANPDCFVDVDTYDSDMGGMYGDVSANAEAIEGLRAELSDKVPRDEWEAGMAELDGRLFDAEQQLAETGSQDEIVAAVIAALPTWEGGSY